ncbi:MAG: DNA helicase RecG, partial [Cyanobacteria bacterium J06648_11]
RVGRGAAQSFCILMTQSKAENAKQRLKVLEQSNDGFFIAEMDLRLRGPGEVLGTRQSGLPDFALASLIDDRDTLELARQTAEDIVKRSPDLSEFPRLRRGLQTQYERLMGGAIFT